jgi:hypothetical protein
VRARDVIGRRIVAVNQRREGLTYDGDGRELSSDWVLLSLDLDNGKRIVLHAVETDLEPAVTAWVQ